MLGRLPGTDAYRNVLRFPEAQCRQDQLILRVDAQFYFGNVTSLRHSLNEMCSERPHLRTVILDASGMNQLDSSALEALQEIDQELSARGLVLSFAEVEGPVRDVLERSGWLARLRAEGRFFLRVHDAASAASPAGPSVCAGSRGPGCVGELV